MIKFLSSSYRLKKDEGHREKVISSNRRFEDSQFWTNYSMSMGQLVQFVSFAKQLRDRDKAFASIVGNVVVGGDGRDIYFAQSS